ncbi:LutC/YkgG family protein [Nocardioides ferulae]|uniref:LutC/YkgG family protein n=1 Tax=Nocardioides ferulae TaxID=2340821 RepID=UPI000EACA5E1|nr:lactate utilization protein C [Nocardioides ferulae]
MSTAREEILGRVRSALADAAPVAPAERRSPAARRPHEELVDLFAERVADYRAVVQRCTPDELGDVVRAALTPGSAVVLPAGLDLEIPGAVVDGADGRMLTAAELDAVDAVVTEARVGIAETGTVVLDHAAGQGRRALTLVPDRHVCIVRADQVVADVPDAFAVLDPLRPQTWISGPSATSDIELDRVEGVHGPRNLHVIVVG